jgi:hypothetical protein
MTSVQTHCHRKTNLHIQVDYHEKDKLFLKRLQTRQSATSDDRKELKEIGVTLLCAFRFVCTEKFTRRSRRSSQRYH